MAFSPSVVSELRRVAAKSGIEAAALMAVVEVESDGVPVEPADGKTPRLLFERHVFYRELKNRAPKKLQQAVNEGLAIPKWSRATQYKDQGTSSGRLRVLERARGIDEDIANRSCSWGVGQTMGFLAEEQGFKNATEMVAFMVRGGVTAQVECMIREIKKRGLVKKMNAHDWAGFARSYNGPGYAQNQYDVKMATAYRKWKAKLGPQPLPPDVEQEDEDPIVIPPSRVPDEKTIPKSKTVWAVVLGIITSIISAVGDFLMDWKVIAVICTFVLIGLFLFIGKERIQKIWDQGI